MRLVLTAFFSWLCGTSIFPNKLFALRHFENATTHRINKQDVSIREMLFHTSNRRDKTGGVFV